jgi:hypothetical protein
VGAASRRRLIQWVLGGFGIHFRQQTNHFQEALQTQGRSRFVGVRPAVEAFSRRKIPFVAHTEKAVAPKGNKVCFTLAITVVGHLLISFLSTCISID